MKKYKALLFAMPVLAVLTAAPAYIAALAGQDPIHERGAQKTHSHAAQDAPSAAALDLPAFKKMIESGAKK